MCNPFMSPFNQVPDEVVYSLFAVLDHGRKIAIPPSGIDRDGGDTAALQSTPSFVVDVQLAKEKAVDSTAFSELDVSGETAGFILRDL